MWDALAPAREEVSFARGEVAPVWDEVVLSPSRDELVAPLAALMAAREVGGTDSASLNGVAVDGRPDGETEQPARPAMPMPMQSHELRQSHAQRRGQEQSPATHSAAAASRRAVVVAAAVAAVGVPVMVSAAVVVLPNTIGAVLPEALDDLGVTDPRLLASAFGASLPAAAAAVPVAAAAARRFSPALVLMVGLVMLAAGQLAGGLVGDLAAGTPGTAGLLGELVGGAGGEALGLVFAVRILLGLGAGTVLAGMLLYAAHLPGRAGRLLCGWYAGVLVAALLAAIALAAPSDWRMLLQPYPMVTGPALALSAALLWFQGGLPRAGRPPARSERALGSLPLLPALGLTVLAYASTLGWSPIARLTAAVLAAVAVLLLGHAGAADRSAARLAAAPAAAMTGILAFPTATVVAGTLLGYGPYTLVWGVLIAAAGTAVGAGAVAGALPGRTTGFAGYVLVIAGMALLYAGLNPATPLPPGPLPIAAGTVLLAAGLGTALGSGLAGTRGPAAAYALALLLPGALAGLMLAAAINATAPAPARLWPVVAAAIALASAPGLIAGTARTPR